MSSSPHKNYNNAEIIRDHLQKLKSIKESGLIQPHEIAQMDRLEDELKNIEAKESLNNGN